MSEKKEKVGGLEFLSLHAVMELVMLNSNIILELEKKFKFPQRHYFEGKDLGWLAHDIGVWLRGEYMNDSRLKQVEDVWERGVAIVKSRPEEQMWIDEATEYCSSIDAISVGIRGCSDISAILALSSITFDYTERITHLLEKVLEALDE